MAHAERLAEFMARGGLPHISDTMVPVDLAPLGQRLEMAGFDEVEVKKRLGELRFRAIRAP